MYKHKYTAVRALQAGRMRAANKWPYLATAFWALIPVATPGMGEQAGGHIGVDDQGRLYYDPDHIEKWSVVALAAALYHEVSHVLRDHAGRCKSLGADRRRWNLAGDAEINDDKDEDFVAGVKELPFKIITPKTYDLPENKFAEWYYDQIPEDADGGGMGGGKCGSGAGGQKQPWELPDGAAQDSEGDEVPALDAAEQDLVRNQVAHEIQQASKTRGNVPTNWERWASETLNPTIPWQRQLTAAARHAIQLVRGQGAFTYKRPSRRSRRDLVLPGIRRPIPNVAIVADTSGSMSSTYLAQALAECKGVLKALGGMAAVHVFSVDAAVHTAQKVFDARQIKLAGGGGTDMGVGIHRALDEKPDIIIVLTDGYTPWPTSVAGVKVIAGIIGGDCFDDRWAPPSYVKRINIPVEAA